jgi:hypothetical protein
VKSFLKNMKPFTSNTAVAKGIKGDINDENVKQV